MRRRAICIGRIALFSVLGLRNLALAASASRLLAQASQLGDSGDGREDADNREEVVDSDEIPYSLIGPVVSAISETERLGCTGALIQSDVVLTAAHCLHRLETGQDVLSAQFAPGYNSRQSPHAPAGVANMAEFWIPDGFRQCGTGGYSECHRQHDIAVVRLDASFDTWLDFGFDDQNAGAETINTAGYPGDKDNCFDLQGESECSLYHVTCDDDAVAGGTPYVTSSCFAFNGQSGSPMWLYFSDTQTRQIRGVLAAKIVGAPGSSFTLITEAVYRDIQRVMASWRGKRR